MENSLDKLINIFINKETNQNKKNRSVSDDKANNKNVINEKNLKSKSQCKKRHKYKKFGDNNIINKYIENIEIKEKDSNIYQYHISNFYSKTNAANYYCADTGCPGRIKIIYDFKNNDNDKIMNEIIFRKEHDKPYREHSFCRLDIVKSELSNLSKNEIIKKLSDYKYRHLILKEIAFSNPSKFSKARDLEEYFISEYGNIKIKYNKISSKDKEQILKNNKNKESNIEKILTLMNLRILLIPYS